jgi:hypothetical protein
MSDATLQELILEVLQRQFVPATHEDDVAHKPWPERIPRLFPRYASRPFSVSHQRFWDIEDTCTREKAPHPVALILPRGQGKSTTAEMAAADLIGSGRRKFVLYFCSTQERANEHVANIAALIEGPEFQAYFPGVGQPKIGLHGNQKAWRQSELILENGGVIRALGLDSVIRGIKVEGFRPDAIFGDDFDEITDSPQTIQKKINILTKSIIPARATSCWIVLFQNLIHAGSIMTQVARGTAGFLHGCESIGPVKAIDDLDYRIEEDGSMTLLAGTPTWPEGMPWDVCQQMAWDMGPEAFLTECQQDVDRMMAGAVYPSWDEKYHIVTEAEFLRVVTDAWMDAEAKLHMPPRWAGAIGHDWGATVKHPAAATWWYTPDAQAARWGIAGIRHKVRELVAPWNRDQVAAMTPQNFGEAILAAMWRDEETGDTELDQINYLVMSHEASSERHTYATHLSTNLTFGASRAGRTGGIAQMRSFLAVDMNRPHPYRKVPAGFKEERVAPDGEVYEYVHDGDQPLMGCPNVVWVVADGHGELRVDDENNLYVVPGRGDAGMERGRWEMLRYHWDTTVDGREHQYPYPLDEDVMCADRYVAYGSFPQERPLTLRERVEQELERRGASLPISTGDAELDLDQRIAAQQYRLIAHNHVVAEVSSKQARAHTAVRRHRPGIGRKYPR